MPGRVDKLIKKYGHITSSVANNSPQMLHTQIVVTFYARLRHIRCFNH